MFRSEVAHHAGLAVNSALLSRLPLPQRLKILSAASTMFFLTGCKRKRAVVLRELAALLAENGSGVKGMLDEIIGAYGLVGRDDDEELGDWGWPELQIAVLKDAITTAEIVSGNIRFFRLFSTLTPSLALKKETLPKRLRHDVELSHFGPPSDASGGPTYVEENDRESIQRGREKRS
jgi:hypothetical protein